MVLFFTFGTNLPNSWQCHLTGAWESCVRVMETFTGCNDYRIKPLDSSDIKVLLHYCWTKVLIWIRRNDSYWSWCIWVRPILFRKGWLHYTTYHLSGNSVEMLLKLGITKMSRNQAIILFLSWIDNKYWMLTMWKQLEVNQLCKKFRQNVCFTQRVG